MNRGHSSATQLNRILAVAEAVNQRPLAFVGEVVGKCELCQDLDEAPHMPVAGASSASSFSGKL